MHRFTNASKRAGERRRPDGRAADGGLDGWRVGGQAGWQAGGLANWQACGLAGGRRASGLCFLLSCLCIVFTPIPYLIAKHQVMVACTGVHFIMFGVDR